MNNGCSNRTVLIVDFARHYASEITAQLRELQYTSIVNTCLKTAVTQIKKTDPSLILLGTPVPEDEGETIIQVARAAQPPIPVMLVTKGDELPEKFSSSQASLLPLLVYPASNQVLEHTLLHIQSSARLARARNRRILDAEVRNAKLEVHVDLLSRKFQYGQFCAAQAESDWIADRQAHVAVQLAIENTRDAVLILDECGRIQYCNPAFEILFGDRHHLETIDLLDKLFSSPDTRGEVLNNIHELDSISCEVEMIDRDGHVFPVVLNANTIRKSRYDAQGILFLFTDISEQERLRAIANQDTLTGVCTRGHFLEQLTTNISMAMRHENSLSLCLCDLDEFKRINDTYGHGIGDKVLQSFAWVVKQEIRAEDATGRIGGDEFALVFPQVDASTASACMERIRKRFQAITFKGPDGSRFTCSVTLGLVDCPHYPISNEALLKCADKSLYRAKELGRNCTVVNMEMIGTTAA